MKKFKILLLTLAAISSVNAALNFKKTMGLIILLLSNVSFAAGYTDKGEIKGLSSLYSNNGKLEFELYGSWPNLDTCTKADRWIVGRHNVDTDETTKSKYSMVMAAYMANKTIELYVDDCGSSNRPIVKLIFLPEK